MAEDTRSWESNSPVDKVAASREEISLGWCANCICKNRYHIGSDSGACISCNCEEFTPDSDTDLLDRLQVYLLPELPTEEPFEEYTPEELDYEVSIEVGDLVAHNTGMKDVEYSALVFLGKASRSCKQCGETKLYKEFDGNPTDPQKLCNSCQDWVEREDVLEYLTDYEQEELEALERDTEEAEEEYEDIWERQHMIDDVLRELDG